MANKSVIVTVRGSLMYAKVLGPPVLAYDKENREWTFDLVIDNDTKKEMKTYGIADKVKQKDDFAEGQPYLHFKQPELRRDYASGEMVKNDPIKFQDILGEDWGQERLLGNGTVVDAKFKVVDYGPGKKKGMYILSVRVLDLVPYERQTFTKIEETDPYYQKALEALAAKAAPDFEKDFGLQEDELDDEIPL